MEAGQPPLKAVHGGPKAYRRRLRNYGPLAGLVGPGALGALAWLLLRNNTQTWRGLGGFLIAVLAAPGFLLVGAPLSNGGGTYILAIASSAALWLLLGVVAARIATRSPVATWRDYWREYCWLAGAVWAGAVVALVAADLILGGAFL